MNEIENKIEKALNQEPDYSRLSTLPYDVQRRIRDVEQLKYSNYSISPVLNFSTIMLSVLAFIAIAQVSFQPDSTQTDIFDLRYFSHQSIPSLNLASVNTYEYLP